jgi:hypothetical protein
MHAEILLDSYLGKRIKQMQAMRAFIGIRKHHSEAMGAVEYVGNPHAYDRLDRIQKITVLVDSGILIEVPYERSWPAFALTAILTIALGVGANTALFGVIYTVLIQPLRFRDPGKLVHRISRLARSS